MPTSITGQGISIYPAPDDALSSTSKNPVQNKVIDEELTDQKNAIEQKAPVIINTASGDIASFADGAYNMPMQSIIGTIAKSSTRVVFGNGGSNLCNTSLLAPYGTLRQFVYYPSTNSYYVSTINTYTGVYVPVRVVAGKTYTFSFKYAGTSDQTTKQISLVTPSGTDRKSTSESSSSGTGYLSTTYTALYTETLNFRIYLRRGSSNNFYGTVSEIRAEEGSQRTADNTTVLVANFIDPETSEPVTFTQGTVALNNDGSLDVVSTAGDDVTLHIDDVGHLYTQKGINNVWISTGAITTCDYPADTKLYVDGLTASDEDMIADANIASGKYFVVNNQLYLSTAAIAAGASIVPGTNCTATNLAEALNALNT